MPANILVINSGSSSLKFGLFALESCQNLCNGTVDWSKGSSPDALLYLNFPHNAGSVTHFKVSTHDEAVGAILQALTPNALSSTANSEIMAVGHRVVHGGSRFRESVLVDSSVRKSIAELASLAPLHNPHALAAMTAVDNLLPGLPQVAVFDTSFFCSLPSKARVYPLPYAWFSDWGVQRFGFHGISHSYCAQRADELLQRPQDALRLVVCHLGNGCSASAIIGRKAIATTMGFTPLDGLMMGTRPGALDPGIILDVQRRQGLTTQALHKILNEESGLLGVSGVSSDFREVEAAASAGNARAILALEMFTDRVRATIGSLAVTMGGIDALVFTAGIGENSNRIRTSICDGLECLGLQLDIERNACVKLDADVAAERSSARILVIRCREDLLIARDTARIVYPHVLCNWFRA